MLTLRAEEPQQGCPWPRPVRSRGPAPAARPRGPAGVTTPSGFASFVAEPDTGTRPPDFVWTPGHAHTPSGGAAARLPPAEASKIERSRPAAWASWASPSHDAARVRELRGGA